VDTALPSSISPQDLAARIGRADAPLLLDVRREERFAASPFLIAGARHCAPEAVGRWLHTQPPQPAVVYCVHGHDLSREAARVLRGAGWDARFLAGGIEGGEDGVDDAQAIAAWCAVRLPLVRRRPDLGVTGEAPSRWITRERPKIDRIACPWLVRRFIDPAAEFFYVPTDQVFAQAARLHAVAYDIPGAPVSHEGERCSFDALLAAFDLRDPALHALATIVRGADTDRLDLAPQSAGLLAFSLGLSRLHQDDHALLAAALPLYDALYAWCRDAAGERHGWNPDLLVGAAP
jgi:rhodanese-related sulfurtransferase